MHRWFQVAAAAKAAKVAKVAGALALMKPASRGKRDHERLPPLYREADRHLADHGGSDAGRHRWLSWIVHRGAAGSRLSDYSGHHSLSRRQPRSHDLGRPGPVGATVRPDRSEEHTSELQSRQY